MRELVFTLEYEPGCNAVADTLMSHSKTEIRSLSLHATAESLWRVDLATGDESALAAVKSTFETADYYADCLATDHCGATQTTDVLEHSDDRLVLYSYWERTPECSSVPHLALSALGEGALFETTHQQRSYTWRIIHSGGNVGQFFAALEDAVGDCATLDIQRLTEATPPEYRTTAEDNRLSPEQETALQADVHHGYYDTPRNVSASELSEILSVPRSTLTYRLRRAEAQLAKQHTDKLADWA